MSRRVGLRKYAATLIAALLSSSLYAGSYGFDLDVPAGHFSYLEVGDVASIGRLSGSIKFLELRTQTKWNPLFSVIFKGADDHELSVKFIPLDKGRKLMVQMQEQELEPFVAVFNSKMAVDIPISMQWSQDGDLTLSLPDGSMHRVKFAGIHRVRVSASSADVEGNNWVIPTSSLNSGDQTR